MEVYKSCFILQRDYVASNRVDIRFLFSRCSVAFVLGQNNGLLQAYRNKVIFNVIRVFFLFFLFHPENDEVHKRLKLK